MRTRISSLITIGVMLQVACSAPLAELDHAKTGLVSEHSPRVAVREDAVGCWLLQGMADEPTPSLARLDSLMVQAVESVGHRLVQRIDSLGHAQARDREGFEVRDSWSADRDTDTIRIVFDNGLYGSTWALELPERGSNPGLMRGVAKGFGDVVPGPNYPQRSVNATRVSCPVASSSSSGV